MSTSRREFVRYSFVALAAGCAGCTTGKSTTDTGHTDTGTGAGSGTDTGTGTTNDTAVPDGWTAVPVAKNKKLGTVGGYVYKDLKKDRIIVARIDDTPTYVALSSACTHEGCDVVYDMKHDEMYCPCHGSVFADDGTVTKSPARKPLKAYETQWDEPNNRVLVHVT